MYIDNPLSDLNRKDLRVFEASLWWRKKREHCDIDRFSGDRNCSEMQHYIHL